MCLWDSMEETDPQNWIDVLINFVSWSWDINTPVDNYLFSFLSPV